MNDDTATQQDDTTEEMDSLNGQGTKYSAGLYETDEEMDTLDGTEDLNNLDAELDEGTGDDAMTDFDEDDSTLSANNDDDETETGMDESDADDLAGKENLGDEVMTSDEV